MQSSQPTGNFADSINSAVNFNQPTQFNGPVSANSTLRVTGSTVLNDTLTATALTLLNGETDLAGKAMFTGTIKADINNSGTFSSHFNVDSSHVQFVHINNANGFATIVTLGAFNGVGLPDTNAVFMGGIDRGSGVMYGITAAPDSVTMSTTNMVDSSGNVGATIKHSYMDFNNSNGTNSLTIDGDGLHYEYQGVNIGSWPNADGSNGQVLKTNGAGVWSWYTLSGGTGWLVNGNTGMGYNDFIGSDTKLNFQCFGNPAGQLNIGNTTYGRYAGTYTGSNDANCAFGDNCLPLIDSTNTSNSGFGQQALQSLTSGNENSSFGELSLGNLTTGSYNCSIGGITGQALTNGSKCILIGDRSNTIGATRNNAIAIGANAIVGQDNSMSLMDTTQPYQVGIGTAYPGQALDVRGSVNVSNKLFVATTPTSATITSGGDVYVMDNTKGIILKDAAGVCWRISVAITTGALTTTSVSCP